MAESDNGAADDDDYDLPPMWWIKIYWGIIVAYGAAMLLLAAVRGC